MVGSALKRRLENEDCAVLTATSAELDLQRQQDTLDWAAAHRPDVIFLVAAKVGGIYANDQHLAKFLKDNLMIETNVIQAAHQCGVEKLRFLGSACIYPKLAPQPMTEEALLTGPLEPTNEWCAVAKIAGIMMCQTHRKQYGSNFITAQPNSLYGPGDNFHPVFSHVIPALIVKTHEAKLSGAPSIEVWGSGSPLRDFLHVDDLAGALIFLIESYSNSLALNIGSGQEIRIGGMAQMICELVGFTGHLVFNTEMPDGMQRKLLDTTRLTELGWTPQRNLHDGLAEAYAWYLEHVA
jgi:GDP-L-fucose synthase